MKTAARRLRALTGALVANVALLAWLAPGAGAFEWLGQYGTGFPGGGNGQVSSPAGVAVAGDGTVFVSDIANSRVAVFAADGRFLRAFGGDVSIDGGTGPEVCVNDCKQGVGGTGGGSLLIPLGVAVLGDEVFVSEQGTMRISVFSREGQFLRAYGADVGGPGVNVCTGACGPGTSGVAAGQLKAPAGLAVDADGNLYVAELGSFRVDVFDAKTGQFLRAFGKDVGGAGVDVCTTTCGAGTDDGSPGSFHLPYGVSVSPRGDLVVTDQAPRISVFDSQGQLQRAFGAPGPAVGQLSSPNGAVAPGDGFVYVADTLNKRLAVFDESGGFNRAYGFDVIPGPPAASEVCTTSCQPGTFVPPTGSGIGDFAPTAIAYDCRKAIYVANFSRVEKWGEPGAGVPPCVTAPPPPAPSLALGKLTRNKKKGTARLAIRVSGPGSLTVRGPKTLKATVPQPTAAGTVAARIRAAGKGLRALKKKGKLRGKLKVTFTPLGGAAIARARTVTLVKKLKNKHRTRKRKHHRHGRR